MINLTLFIKQIFLPAWLPRYCLICQLTWCSCWSPPCWYQWRRSCWRLRRCRSRRRGDRWGSWSSPEEDDRAGGRWGRPCEGWPAGQLAAPLRGSSSLASSRSADHSREELRRGNISDKWSDEVVLIANQSLLWPKLSELRPSQHRLEMIESSQDNNKLKLLLVFFKLFTHF